MSFKAAELILENANLDREVPKPEDLGFGRVFSDHMLTIDWDVQTGWEKPRIVPYGPLQMDPACGVLHYGMSCFEGMKAYYGVSDGKGRLFRPLHNMARLKRSMDRLGFPTDWDDQELLDCIKELLRVDRKWLPAREGFSIYIRPFAFASAAALGLQQAKRVTIACILSPSGPYYKQGLKPLDLFIDEVNVRAWPGGSGDRKVANNYAPTVRPVMDADKQHHCAQVLFLLPHSNDSMDSTLSEAGTMNIFVVLDKGDGTIELATPPLEGTILPGITRLSLLELARGWEGVEVTAVRAPLPCVSWRCEVRSRPCLAVAASGACVACLQVSERNITLREMVEAAKTGRLLEAFGSGTAAVVSPVQRFKRASGEVLECARDMEGKDTLCWRLYEAVTAIQVGKTPHEWSVAFE